MNDKTVIYNLGDIHVPGVTGYFAQMKKGMFTHIKHVLTNPNNKTIFNLVGSIPIGVYGEPGQFPAKANDQYKQMVEDSITKYIERKNLQRKQK